jgi:hypothetical protein
LFSIFSLPNKIVKVLSDNEFSLKHKIMISKLSSIMSYKTNNNNSVEISLWQFQRQL